MGARIPLPDGRKVPVSDDYALRYKAMSADQRRAEFPTLIRQADKLGIQPAGQEPPPGEASPAPAPGATEKPADAVSPPQVSAGEDFARGLAAGGRRGLEGILATPQDLYTLGGRGVSWLQGKPFKEADYDIPLLPSSEDIHQATTPFIGESYVPQGRAGKFGAAIGEVAGGAVGPSMVTSPLRTAARVGLEALGGGIAGEGAAELAEGTALEGPARLVGTVAGTGAAGAARGAGTNVVKQGERQAEQAVEDAAAVHGVTLPRGQRTDDVNQQIREQQMLKGARGPAAQRLMRENKEANEAALQTSADKLADQAAPQRGVDQVDAGGKLNFSTRRRVERSKAAGGKLIDRAEKAGVMLDADRLRNLESEVTTALEGNIPHVPDVVVSKELTPTAAEAMARINRFAKQAEDPSVKEFSLAGANELRKRLIGLTSSAAPKSEDARALSKIIDHFDDWMQDAAGKGRRNVGPNALSGPGVRTSAQVAAELKTGQRLWRRGKQVEEPRGADAQKPGASRVAEIATDAHATDTARLFKPDANGNLSASALDAIDRLVKTGAKPNELDQVRGIVLEELTKGSGNKRFDAGRAQIRIDGFLRNNPEAAKVLFPQELRDKLKQYGTTSRATVPHPDAQNFSQSSFPLIKELGSMAARRVPGLSLVTGPIADAWTNFKGFQAAREALKPATRDTLAEEAAKAGGVGAARGVRRGAAGANQVTIDDPDDPHDGETATIISEGRSGLKVRLPNGQEKIIGKALVK